MLDVLRFQGSQSLKQGEAFPTVRVTSCGACRRIALASFQQAGGGEPGSIIGWVFSVGPPVTPLPDSGWGISVLSSADRLVIQTAKSRRSYGIEDFGKHDWTCQAGEHFSRGGGLYVALIEDEADAGTSIQLLDSLAHAHFSWEELDVHLK